MKDPLTNFGREMRRLRMSKGLNQSEFADRWNVDRAQVSVFETTKRVPSLKLLKRFSDAFQVDPIPWVIKDKDLEIPKETIAKDTVLYLPRGSKLSLVFQDEGGQP